MGAVRTTRARIIYLRNDYKELMSVIEKHLHEHFANLEDGDEPVAMPAGGGVSGLTDSVPETLDPAFAKVNAVTPNSPAETAGLKPGDLIRNFGYVNHGNHNNLARVSECVMGNEGVSCIADTSLFGDGPRPACWLGIG
jgi:26S proteasome regulatory subunit N4